MPSRISYLPIRSRRSVRPAARRPNRSRRSNLPLQIRRGARGRFTKTGGTALAKLPSEARKVAKRRSRSKPKSRHSLARPKSRRPKHSRKGKGRSRSKSRGKSRSKSRGKSRSKSRYSFPTRANPGRRTRTVVVHHTKRLRNPVGFDGTDSLKSLKTWAKVLLAVVYGLGGFVVAFGVPKGLAVASGKDFFQRGWGGVITSGTATVGAALLIGLVSRRAGYCVLAAGLTGTALYALYAIFGASADMVIPVQESLLAAALPTLATTPALPPPAVPGASDWNPGSDARSHARMLAMHGKGPSDWWPGTPGARAATQSNDSSFYANPLKPKERF